MGRKPAMTVAEHPVLSRLWSRTRNEADPAEVAAGSSSQKYWWECGKPGHYWESLPLNILHGKREVPCPVCAGRKVVLGINNLGTIRPDVAALWHPGNEVAVSAISPGSSRTVRWLCPEGHEWRQRINRATSECPECSYPPGINVSHPEIARWCLTGDAVFLPADSGKKAEWACPESHHYEASVSSRVKAGSCLVCSGRIIQPGVNDLPALYPAVAAEWHPAKNNGTAAGVSPADRTKRWWLCGAGHEWQQRPGDRTKSGRGCPECLGYAGASSIQDTHLAITSYWDSEANRTAGLALEHVSYGSDVVASWRCPQGHTWEKAVRAFILTPACPWCERHTSAGERELLDWLASVPGAGRIVASSRKVIPPYELDAYLPEHKLAIEFNGLYWHSEAVRPDREYHVRKRLACRDRGIELVQIWEDDWAHRRDAVKSHVLGKLAPPVPALYEVTELPPSTSTGFLRDNSLRTSEDTGLFLGAFAGEKLVAVMAFSYPYTDTAYLYAHSSTPGHQEAFTAILAAAWRYPALTGCAAVRAEVSNDLGNHGELLAAGFTEDGIAAPACTYLAHGTRTTTAPLSGTAHRIWDSGTSILIARRP